MLPQFTPSPIEASVLDSFAKELDTLIEAPKDIEKMIRIMEKLLAEASIESMQIPEEEGELVSRVTKIQDMLTSSNPDFVNTIAKETLKGKMLEMIASKTGQIKSLQACKELCQTILPKLSFGDIQSF